MEALLSQFTFLSDQALQDKNFDPSAIEDLMKLFETESYQAWTAMELEHQEQLKQAEITMQEAEDYLDSVMERSSGGSRRKWNAIPRTKPTV
ncbi:transmembrane emp24 domain-containing protein p24delta3-like [Hibiscus syriacus]|uniref:Transmembrane emp24 domain-containing protein p24delta3-like n=1 Tax=Hibiscus syriacus TaxID=106335 RepID=A0A6A3ATC7_HIBSY|nr:transmembrane emp24 domain-containing protein p24delta3-like [Hibiscus syriacus]